MTQTQSQTLRFIHRFSRTLSCEFQIPAAPPAPGQLLSPTCCWSGRPKPKHIPAYRQCALLVHQSVADQWQQRILYALGIAPDRTEIWPFEPGEPPKLLGKIKVGVPGF
jgi:hypothetical protein